MGVVDKLMGLKLFPFKDLWQDREVSALQVDCKCTASRLQMHCKCTAAVADAKAHLGGHKLEHCQNWNWDLPLMPSEILILQ
eukprot:scaffold201266_cov18-Tisochrysis_lutea.AAC.1